MASVPQSVLRGAPSRQQPTRVAVPQTRIADPGRTGMPIPISIPEKALSPEEQKALQEEAIEEQRKRLISVEVSKVDANIDSIKLRLKQLSDRMSGLQKDGLEPGEKRAFFTAQDTTGELQKG